MKKRRKRAGRTCFQFCNRHEEQCSTGRAPKVREPVSDALTPEASEAMRAFTLFVICGAGAAPTHALLRGARLQARLPWGGLEKGVGAGEKNGRGSAQGLTRLLDNGLGSWVPQTQISEQTHMQNDSKLLARQIKAVDRQLTSQKKELAFARMFPNNKSEITSRRKEVKQLEFMLQRFRAQQAELTDAQHVFARDSLST